MSLCWWWLALQLLIKCSIHFSDWAIKVLLWEHPLSALFRACRLCCRRAVHFCGMKADWAKPRFESINSITAVWIWFKVNRREAALVWTQCIQGFNWDFFCSYLSLLFPTHDLLFCIHVLSSSRAADDLQATELPYRSLSLHCLKSLCNTYTEAPYTQATPSGKVMQKSCSPTRPETCTLCIFSGYTFMCAHIVNTDLSNIKWFQSGVFLQDKELVPHPASLHPLEQCWAACVFLPCGLTQKAVRKKGQYAKGHGEQGASNCWKIQSVSHR